MTRPMPVVFLGHGNPMNAIRDTVWARAWARLGKDLPRPRAVLSVSAHWFVPETAVTSMLSPRTIHDFGGFPRELFEVEYPAPGSPPLAEKTSQLLAPLAVRADHAWGLDHGTWSVLRHLFPDADVPVVQLSIDASRPPAFHYKLGRRLAPLRDEGILLVGSGNVVHNLRAYAWNTPSAPPFDWALRFDATVRDLAARGDHQALTDYPSLGPDAALAVPTPEHYLPLLYVLGAGLPGEPMDIVAEGMEGRSISMLSLRLG